MKRLAAVALALLAACASPPPAAEPSSPLPGPAVPLAELADSARLVVETDVVDFGATAHRDALWWGWGPNESSPEGSFVWGAGGKSRLRLEVVEPRDRTLRLRGWSYPFGDAPPQEVRVEVEGREIGRRKLDSDTSWIEIELPGDALRAGENFLDLRYGRHAEGDLPWAVGWESLRLSDPRAGLPPRIDREADRIVLPARTAIEWTLELTGGSWLAWNELDARGDARLAVSIVGEESRRELPASERRGRFRLTDDGAPYRLFTVALRALGDGGEIQLAGLRLHSPDLVATRAPAPAVAASTAPASPPNLILYVIDTLRADHLGCYGYARPTSPAIDAFARRAVRFREARAQSSWTRPAVGTLLTGLHPITHGAQQTDVSLPARVVTLAERLSDAGWQTAMVSTNGNAGRRVGFAQGFQHFVQLKESVKQAAVHVRAPVAHATALEWLDRRDRAKPFFLVIHTTDPHDPYTPTPRFRQLFAPDVTDSNAGTRQDLARLAKLDAAEAAPARDRLMALYDAEIAQNDAAFGELLAELARRGLDRATAFVLTSDHGEEFFEHGGWTHGQTLYEEQLRIPLLLQLPDHRAAGTVIADPVEQVDVAPTLLALAGLPIPAELPGRDLAKLLGAPPGASPGHAALAWLKTRGLDLASVVRSDWKLIENRVAGNPLETPPFELYSLGSDAEEKHDLALGRAVRRSWLAALVARGVTRYGSSAPAEKTHIDPELRATLEALGYL